MPGSRSQRHSPRRRRWAGLVSLLLPLSGLAAGPGSGSSARADCGLEVARRSDAHAYYLGIGFGSLAAADIAVRVRGRALQLRVWQDAGEPGAVCRYRVSRTFRLPPDADAHRLKKREEPGRVLVVIPRRAPLWSRAD
jgi:hypothetical protein